MRKALVTGGCGFIGSWIVKRLRERNVEVRVLAYPGEPRDNLEGVVCEFIEGDVRDPEVCEKAVDGCDTVFHAAAVYESWTRDPTRMYDVNMRGTFHIIEASRRKGVEKVIYTASIVSLGRPVPGTLANEHTAFEAWEIDFPYARSKYLSRELAEYFAAWGVDVRIVCPGVVIGPNDIRPTPSGELIRTSMTMKGPAITFAGGASYVDVRDAAEGHVLVALRGKPGERYIITAHNLSNTEFVQLVERTTGRNRPIITLPIPIARAVVSGFEVQSHVTGKAPFISKAFFEYSLKPAYFSNEKARRELGMNFRPIEESIRDAAEWFRSRGMV
ncbi:MAG: NAD-dependent epimerase/dehydratase family protein [Sandaracinaceae bacterium]|nr:NAD-dependent epimerase/dehydratase family protein [Sandaracinaceae bacterium]